MGEKITIQGRVKLFFMFGKNGATYRSGARLLGHPVDYDLNFLIINQ